MQKKKEKRTKIVDISGLVTLSVDSAVWQQLGFMDKKGIQSISMFLHISILFSIAHPGPG